MVNELGNEPENDMKHNAFEQRAREVLQQSAEQLDGATRSRLTQARYAALDAAAKPSLNVWRWLAPATGVAAAAIIAVVIAVQPKQHAVEQWTAHATIDEMEIVTAEDSLDFYRNVEFYAWLDTVLEDEPINTDNEA